VAVTAGGGNHSAFADRYFRATRGVLISSQAPDLLPIFPIRLGSTAVAFAWHACARAGLSACSRLLRSKFDTGESANPDAPG
jgi:hypothetical protein